MGSYLKKVLITSSILTIVFIFTFVVPILPYLFFCNEIDREQFSDVVIDSTGDTIVTGMKVGDFSEDIAYGEHQQDGSSCA